MSIEKVEWESEDKKYKVVFDQGSLKAFRYGETWQDLTGNKLVLAMLQELAELRSGKLVVPLSLDEIKDILFRIGAQPFQEQAKAIHSAQTGKVKQ